MARSYRKSTKTRKPRQYRGSSQNRSNQNNGGDNQGYFNIEHFLTLVDAIFTDAINATGNAGQIAILQEIYEVSVPFLANIAQARKKPSRSVLKSLFVLSSSPEKYLAVSEILEEVTIKIGDAWDDSYAGDSSGQTLYLSIGPQELVDTPPSTNALMYGFRASFYGRI